MRLAPEDFCTIFPINITRRNGDEEINVWCRIIRFRQDNGDVLVERADNGKLISIPGHANNFVIPIADTI